MGGDSSGKGSERVGEQEMKVQQWKRDSSRKGARESGGTGDESTTVERGQE